MVNKVVSLLHWRPQASGPGHTCEATSKIYRYKQQVFGSQMKADSLRGGRVVSKCVNPRVTVNYYCERLNNSELANAQNPVAVLGKNIWGRGAGPSSVGRQQRLGEVTIEPIKNLGAGQDWGLCPRP